MNDAGTITIVSLVSPYRGDRDVARKRHEDQGLIFMEVFMDVPLDVVQDRDPKGLYKKVRNVIDPCMIYIYGHASSNVLAIITRNNRLQLEKSRASPVLMPLTSLL